MDKKQTANVICGAAMTFGFAGLVAPRMLGRLLGQPVEDSMVGAMRLVASRNVVLGLIPSMIDMTDNYDSLLGLAAGMNAIDCVNSLLAGMRGQAPKRGAFTLAAMTGALAALAAVPLYRTD